MIFLLFICFSQSLVILNSGWYYNSIPIRTVAPLTISVGMLVYAFYINTTITVSCVDPITRRQVCSPLSLEVTMIGPSIKGYPGNLTTTSSRVQYARLSTDLDAAYNDTATIYLGQLYNSCKHTDCFFFVFFFFRIN